ncbi:MAG: glutathione ABC transporter permease GsiC, partial [Methanothrix sp.]|nr:glutathione ABC transporter permease GsiC [Methanothrix sp.]
MSQSVVVIIIVSIVVFLLMRLLPGDPLLLYVAQYEITGLKPEQIQQLRVQLGLDKSLPLQYLNWMGKAVHGD